VTGSAHPWVVQVARALGRETYARQRRSSSTRLLNCRGAFRVGAGASTYRGLVAVGELRKGPVPHLFVAATLHV
jgi:hypothetical protein